MANVVGAARGGAIHHGTRRDFSLLCAAAFAALLPLCAAAADDDAATLERSVKAAFLYKFAGYVEWPEAAFAAPDSPIRVGVSGDPLLAAELAQVATGRTVEGRPLSVKRLAEGETVAGLHMLFVGGNERARLASLVTAAPAQPLLVVTDFEGAINHGSAINFVISGGRLRFGIALDNAEKRGLKLSSRLLTVALSVRTGAPP